MKNLILTLIVTTLLLALSSAYAATYYVATSGNDSYTTTQAQNIATPWKTIQKAASTMVAGDIVNVRAGTYNETVTPSNAGTSSNLITYQNYGTETVTITGGFTVPKSYIVVRGFVFTVGNGPLVQGGTTNILLENNIIHDINGVGMFIDGSSAPGPVTYVTLRGNTLYNCHHDGIDLWGNTANITIEYNHMYTFWPVDDDHVDAIQAYGPSGTSNNNVVIRYNYFHDINSEGILFKDFPTYNLTVENNIVFSNFGWDMYIFTTTGATIQHNTMAYLIFDPDNSNISCTNNVVSKIALMNGASMSIFSSHGYNLSAEWQAYTPAGTDITGSPTYTGGAPPTTWGGYQLTSSSLGHNAASDGTDMGTTYYGSGGGDTQAPSVPTGLTSSSITQTSFTLSWTASTDNVGVTGYEVFKNGASIGTSATTSMSVTGLTASTTYSMTVRARDAVPNWSAQSTVLNVTTSASGGDTQAPSVPTGLTSSSITQTSFTLSWTAATDNVGVTGYEVFKNGASIGTSATVSMSVTGLTASTTYSMTVRARDAVPNWSAQSTALNVTTQASGGTTRYEAENAALTGVTVATSHSGYSGTGYITGLDASGDNVTFTVNETNAGSYPLTIRYSNTSDQHNYLKVNGRTQIDVLFPNTNNAWATLNYGNISLNAGNNTIGILYEWGYIDVDYIEVGGSGGGDTQPPSVPTGLASSSITETSFTLSWTASTDNVGVTGYEVFKNGASIGTNATTSMSITGLTASTTYSMTVRARDAVPNWSAQSATFNVTTSDTHAPSVPTGLTSNNKTQTSFTLTWIASTDNVGVTGYEVFKNGASIGTSATTSISVTGLTQYTTYSMTVRARDAVPNWSAQSTALIVTTVDGQAPSVPTGLTSSSMTQTSFTLSWTASTDNVGVTGYEVFKNGASIGTSVSTSMSVTGLTASTTYSMTVRARDAVPNWSAQSTALIVTTASAGDTQAPSVPTGLTSSSIAQTSFTLNWTASTDNVGVTGYEVFKNAVSIGTSATTSMSVTGLTASTTYSMTVRARDVVPNWSAQSTALNVMTASASVTSSTTWQSFTRSTQTGTFTATFDDVPNTANMNGVTGIQNGTATTYSNLACAVRFYINGKIEAINGGDPNYTSSTTVNYTAGTSYHFRLVINVTAHTYSIYVTPNGQGEVTLGTNYAFRSQQAGVTQLTGWSLIDSSGTHTVSNMTFGTSGKISQAENNESESGNNADAMPSKPGTFNLSQNYPNPFNPTTNIEYRIANTGFVSLKIYDVLGREVSTLVNGQKSIGIYTVQWDASNLPSGVYFSRLTVQTQAGMPIVMTKKILFTK